MAKPFPTTENYRLAHSNGHLLPTDARPKIGPTKINRFLKNLKFLLTYLNIFEILYYSETEFKKT